MGSTLCHSLPGSVGSLYPGDPHKLHPMCCSGSKSPFGLKAPEWDSVNLWEARTGKRGFKCQYAVVWPSNKNAVTWFCWDDVHPVKDIWLWVPSATREQMTTVGWQASHTPGHGPYQVWWGNIQLFSPAHERINASMPLAQGLSQRLQKQGTWHVLKVENLSRVWGPQKYLRLQKYLG